MFSITCVSTTVCKCEERCIPKHRGSLTQKIVRLCHSGSSIAVLNVQVAGCSALAIPILTAAMRLCRGNGQSIVRSTALLHSCILASSAFMSTPPSAALSPRLCCTYRCRCRPKILAIFSGESSTHLSSYLLQIYGVCLRRSCGAYVGKAVNCAPSVDGKAVKCSIGCWLADAGSSTARASGTEWSLLLCMTF